MTKTFGLKRLESLKFEFGPDAANEKSRCLQALKSITLKNVDQITRLHEVLCFMRAWPDNADVLARVETILTRFERRSDVKRHADELADTGIAGTAINFGFFAATALWLAHRWPDQLHIDWEGFENAAALEPYLGLLASYSETPALDNVPMELADWIDRLKGHDETDATFVLKRLSARVDDDFLREQLYEQIDIPLALTPGRDTPNRTQAKCENSPIVFQQEPLERKRPDVDAEMRRPVKPAKHVGRAEATRLIELARSAMVTRQRDIDAFAYADPNDVSVATDNDLQFAIYGVAPKRRFLLETLYGFLVLKNGVPISYGAVTSLFNSAEISYSVFDTYRGGESARIYVRSLAMIHHIFGCDTFMVDPYQLGEENEDAIKSGAWWFYQKLGFRPRDKKLLRLMDRELSTMKRRPRHRTSMTVLRQLATQNVYLNLENVRDDVMGILDLAAVGLKITDLFAERFGSDREKGEETLAAEAADRLDVRDFRGWSASEKLARRRWSPLIAVMPNVDRWPRTDREALVQLIRAKGGRRELDYLHAFNRFERLKSAITKLAQS